MARLVAEGLSDGQVAERLGIGVVDVGTELAAVFKKLGLRSRTELALLAPVAPAAEAGGKGTGEAPDPGPGAQEGRATGV